MSIIRRRFTKEQKLEIVNQSMAEGISIESLAEQYKIHSNSIYKWRRQYLKYEDASFPGNRNKMMSPEEHEIARLKKQLREVELEKEILKKALGIFSSPDRKNTLS